MTQPCPSWRRAQHVIVLSVTGFIGAILLSAAVSMADPPLGYYDSVDPSTSAALQVTLHAVIDDHQRYPYTSTATDTWDILELADEDPNNLNNILDIYRNRSFVKEGGGNTFYNREHSWPNSYGYPNDNAQNYPYTDCHALFLGDDGYNSARSNHPYRYCNASCSEQPTDVNNGQGGGTGVYPGNSNWDSGSFTDGTWETWIGRRGDVARAMFYMHVRYEGGTHGITGAAEPDLILTDNQALIEASNTGSNESVAYMGMLTDLLQWHIEDPVDDVERIRNDVVFSFQGNRNPFIDHPEWVDCLFNDLCGCSVPADCDDGLFCNGAEDCVDETCVPGSDPCPGQGCDEAADICVAPGADPWINEIHYDNDSTDTGEFVEIAGPAGMNLTNWQVQGYNGAGGGTYSTLIVLSGTIPDQGGCMGVLDFDFIPMQNGPDGLALIDDSGIVVEFISYEGSFTATDGPAFGLVSVDIGVFETTTTPVGHSLQLSGTGSQSAEFTWQSPAQNTRGLPNTGQTFDACGGCSVPADCDDGLWCNGAEDCVAGSCVAGTPVDCSDGVSCTVDSCNESTDSCDNLANDSLCDNGLFCDGVETCSATLDCQTGTPVNCDDGVGCTDDSCNESTDSCENFANDANCPDDGLFCNGIEYCHSVTDCQSTGDPCGGGTVCNESSDTCDGGPCDGDGTCESGEDCGNCPQDCISGTTSGAECGNGVCEAGNGEDCVSCPADCNGLQSGKPSNRYCCGDGDGENPLPCGDPACSTGGWLCTDEPVAGGSYCCGDLVCEGDEDSGNCSLDCGAAPFCGDATCDPGEDECNCAADCGAPPATETNCTDGIDEDCDGGADCDDPTGDCDADPTCSSSCGNGTCDVGEDCNTCSSDCDGVVNGPPSGRYCCGNGILEGPEGDGRCDGNP